ncbi:glycosyltransferase family 2 protein [Vreelandella alkaliphila]|uniref:glycosyltransferase family 2 protein n=1 Tax=Vreelandella alkaliphila TaxID=272774 RepID=UPI0023314408|nr:glycosyltransferase family 2 protein [Halomonas alkaliphila]
MKQLVKKPKAFFQSKKVEKRVEGYVERVTHEGIEGWVIHLDRKPLSLSIRLEGQEYTLAPQWHTRDDVAAQHGNDFHTSGFTAELPDKVKNALISKKLDKTMLVVLADSHEIKITGDLPSLQTKTNHVASASYSSEATISSEASKEALIGAINNKHGDVVAGIESFDHFVIKGFITLASHETPLLTVKLGKEAQDWPVLLRTPIGDIKTETSDSFAKIGSVLQKAASSKTAVQHPFEIEVPGYVWEDSKAALNNTIEISIHAVSYPGALKISLTSEQKFLWLEDIAKLPESDNKQYLGLLALEHLRFSGALTSLEESTQAYYRDFATTMQLDNFLNEGGGQEESEISIASYSVGFDTQLMWQAQKKLNHKLQEKHNNTFDAISAVVHELQLVGNVKKTFLQSVIPLMAKEAKLLSLKQLTDFTGYYSLDHADNTWAVSLAIAPLVADRQLGRATDAMWRLGKMLDKGWLNTECVWYAVHHIQVLESRGEATQAQAEKMRYAVLTLLDNLQGEWFSRLHDALLQDSLVVMLKKLPLMTDYQQKDVALAAVRHYGLSPSFWQKLDQADMMPTAPASLVRAHQHWQTVQYAFTHLDELTTQWRQVHRALEYFKVKNNPEARFVQRELVASLLSNQAITNQELLELLQDVIGADHMEAVRYAAHPIINETVSEQLVALYRDDIRSALRQNTERASSVSNNAQNFAAKALLENRLGNDQLMAIHNWHAMFLSVDMLTSALSLYPEDASTHLQLIDHCLHQIIADSNPAYWLPAPACTALANLQQLANQHAMIKQWLKGIRATLEAKFGNIHDALFSKITPAAHSAKKLSIQPAWPQDTLVVVYSCRAYLDTRIKAIRETWLQDLKARGIPYVIMVGDGNDTLTGDILELNVSDTYEDLPHKSLKLMEWVYQNTAAQYVLKIDDDCYLDVDNYFNTLAYRKHHYYGRVIYRSVGGMDRCWHHTKSKTQRAQKALDKSPEPALYADGGGAYTLSRIALKALMEAKATPQGKRLIVNSFMEDKLVGDLLAMQGIAPNNEDYECYQRRRTFGSAVPVGMWENIFFPSNATPTQVTHLDTDKDQKTVHEKNKLDALWPKKVWQSCWDTKLTLNSNQLELITSVKKTQDILRAKVCVAATMRNEMIMLPHFLDHYRNMGIRAFIISDNCSDDGTREYLLEQSDVVLYSADTEYKHSHYGVAWQQAILANHCVGKWTLIADADELLVYPGYQQRSLQSYLEEVEGGGYDCVRTDMIDMYPFDDLAAADFKIHKPFEVANWHDKEPLKEWVLGSGWYSNSKNYASSLRHRIDHQAEPNAFVSQKYALIKYMPWMRFSQGIHYAVNVNVAEGPIRFAHFKYHAGFKEKVAEEIQRKQHYDGAKEYQRYAGMIAEANGKFGSLEHSIQMKEW